MRELDARRRDIHGLRTELEAAGARIGANLKTFRCPFHDDRNASAGIYTAADGVPRFKCFVCAVNYDLFDVMALNRQQDVGDLLRSLTAGTNPGRIVPLAPSPPKPEPPKPTFREHGWEWGDRKDVVACYFYNWPDGEPHYRKFRIEQGGRKRFEFERYSPAKDKWLAGSGVMQGQKRVLYRGEQFPYFVQVWIVEGEKCADLLWDLGMLATCSDNGAQGWRPEYALDLAGKDVRILPDNDEPGKAYGLAVAQSLVGLADKIRIVELPGLGPKEDVYDWLTSKGDAL